MPPTNGPVWRECREEMQLTSDQAATLLRITGGALRQIETEKKPASGMLASRAARLYRIPKKNLLRSEKTEPPEKPDKKPAPEPKIERVAPPRRRDGHDDRRGPKRVQGAAAIA